MFKRLAGYEIKSVGPNIYQSKASLDEKILFGKITHL